MKSTSHTLIVISLAGATLLAGCASRRAPTETLAERHEELTKDEEDSFITNEWTRLGGAAVVGAATGTPADLPEGKGRYQPFANGTIVWTQDFGAVLVPNSIFSYWVNLTTIPAAEDPAKNQYDYIGVPKKMKDAPASLDTVAWDESANFERGLIGVTGGTTFAIEGRIYQLYATNPAQFGLPTTVPPHNTVAGLTRPWVAQAFTSGEIWTRNDDAVPVTIALPYGPIFDHMVNVGDQGDPSSSIGDDGTGSPTGSFEKGDLYAFSGGTILVPNSPTDRGGASRASLYKKLGGPKGWLGRPKGSGTSALGAAYSTFTTDCSWFTPT